MRSSLVVSGGIILITGVALFLAFQGTAWLVLIAGGAAASVAGFVLEESTDRVDPPPGYRFCVFCSTPVAEGDERCGHCNGLQPKAAVA